jgi:hypothetical protein
MPPELLYPPPGVMPFLPPGPAPGPYVPTGGGELVQSMIAIAGSDGAIDPSERQLIISVARQHLHPGQVAQLEAQLGQGSAGPSSVVQASHECAPGTQPCAPEHACGHAACCDPADDRGDCDGLLTNLELSLSLEGYKGPLDFGLVGNFGGRAGINWGFPLLRSWGIGGQLGASLGAADFQGNAAQDFANIFGDVGESQEARSQVFVTAGVFHRACPVDGGWNFGIAYDSLIDDYYEENYLTQWRGEIGYVLGPRAAVGVWGAIRDRGDGLRYINGFPPEIQLEFGSVEQVSVFLDGKWACGMDSRVYVGIAEEPGELVVGLRFRCPMNDWLALVASGTYVNPSVSGDGDFESFPGGGLQEEFWNLSIGLSFFPGGKARSCGVAGQRYMPLLPVADNGSFLVDLDVNFF